MNNYRLEKKTFFEEYPKAEDAFNESGFDWVLLENIYSQYQTDKEKLTPTGRSVLEVLRDAPEVHSVRFRMKKPNHLIEKIIRKANSCVGITADNYKEKITDLIGIRVLHLFKEDWRVIHNFITDYWQIQEQFAYHREGDAQDYLQAFKEKDLETRKHPFGYRSVHYIVKDGPVAGYHLAEIQVRTIFEEGWSEIDHKIRYPYDIDNITYSNYLTILNRFAGTADEMGSFIKDMKEGNDRSGEQTAKIKYKQRNKVKELTDYINENDGLDPSVKNEITSKIRELVSISDSSSEFNFDEYLFEENFENFDGWTPYQNGNISYEQTKQKTGTGCLKKERPGNPHGGYKLLDKKTNREVCLCCWVMRPSKETEPEQGGQADRIAIEDEDHNGYGFSIAHGNKKALIERWDGGKAITISERSDLPDAMLDKWYKTELYIREEGRLDLFFYDENEEKLISIEGAMDHTYSVFDRVTIHGGWIYYVDEIKIKKIR